MKTRVKKIELPKLVECPRCDGTGEEPGAPERLAISCWDCEGKKVLPRTVAIRRLANDRYGSEGTIEVDDNAKVSELETTENENGAYVQAWVWVDFEGEPGLDRSR